ncbi:MAG: NAD(P)-dependent alcohol dehydrogenase [Actinomycetota bacterium]|nr:NAD(P)-dependent alcohol dehydrogenase [Actinomycetota bacterium]
MRAQVLTGGGVQGLEIRELPDPTPGPGQIAVRVGATSLNFRDLLMSRSTTGRIPLSDGAGTVIAVGEGVTSVAEGDRVAGCFFQGWLDGKIEARYHEAALGGSIDGMLSEIVVLPDYGVVAAPRDWTDAQTATLPCAGLTAWNALVEGQQIRAGSTVLLLGTGGVSVFGLQFAKMMGARTIITSISDEKLERMHELGADETINYRNSENWERDVLDATDGLGVDLVIEVGGAQTLAKSMSCIRFGGEIALIGMVSGQAEVNPFPLLSRSANLRGVYVGSQRMFNDMISAINVNTMQPLIDQAFPFEDAQSAYRHLRAQTHMGKVVIEV